MVFIQYDHMVEQVSSTVADPTLGNSILSRTSEAGPFGLDAEALHETGDLFIEVRRPVEDQIFCGVFVRECLSQLLNDPGTAWMSGNVPVQNTPSVMGDDEEAVENAKDQRRHGEEVHRGHGFPMIAQKRGPEGGEAIEEDRITSPPGATTLPLRPLDRGQIASHVDSRCAFFESTCGSLPQRALSLLIRPDHPTEAG